MSGRGTGRVTQNLVSKDINKKSLKVCEQKAGTIRFTFAQSYSSTVLRVDFKGQGLLQGDQLEQCYSTYRSATWVFCFLTVTLSQRWASQSF